LDVDAVMLMVLVLEMVRLMVRVFEMVRLTTGVLEMLRVTVEVLDADLEVDDVTDTAYKGKWGSPDPGRTPAPKHRPKEFASNQGLW
jgi:hypothetical protein